MLVLHLTSRRHLMISNDFLLHARCSGVLPFLSWMFKWHICLFARSCTIPKWPYLQAMWREDSPSVLRTFMSHSSLLSREVTVFKSSLSQALCSWLMFLQVCKYFTWSLQQRNIAKIIISNTFSHVVPSCQLPCDILANYLNGHHHQNTGHCEIKEQVQPLW